MTHDPLCEWRPCTCPLDYDVPERGHMIGCPEDDCECEIIAKVRVHTLSKAIDLIQPIWERGKALDDAVFADGWLTCFESCESALETMRDQVIVREASLAVIDDAGHLVEQRANQFNLDEVCARLGIDAQRVRDLIDLRQQAEES